MITQEEDNKIEIRNQDENQNVHNQDDIRQNYDIFNNETESDNQTDVHHKFDKLSFHELIDLEEFYVEEQTDDTKQNNGDKTCQDLDQNNELTTMKESNIKCYTKSGDPVQTPQRYLIWAILVKSEM